MLNDLNPFHATGLFLCPSETSENQWLTHKVPVMPSYRNQPLDLVNQLTGFYMRATLALIGLTLLGVFFSFFWTESKTFGPSTLTHLYWSKFVKIAWWTENMLGIKKTQANSHIFPSWYINYIERIFGFMWLISEKIWGESHIDFRIPCAIMTLAGWGIITDVVLKMRKVIEFQTLCPATAHLCRWNISRK